MVELLLRWFPVNQAEIFAVVLEMAADTVLTIRIRHLYLRVIPALRRKSLSDFFMAVETLKRRSAGPKLVTTRTLCCAAE